MMAAIAAAAQPAAVSAQVEEIKASWNNRITEYLPKKQQQEELNMARTAPSSAGNIAAAKKLRSDFDKT